MRWGVRIYPQDLSRLREPDDKRKEKEMENGGKDEEGETKRKEGGIDEKENVGGGSGLVVGREAGEVGVQGGFRCEKQQKCRRKVRREGGRGVGKGKGKRRRERNEEKEKREEGIRIGAEKELK